jgi:hypothetical protein
MTIKTSSPRSNRKLSPVDLVVSRFAESGIGIRHLSRLLGGSDFLVPLWKYRGDAVPSCRQMHTRLIKLAGQKGVKLSYQEINEGGFL